MTTVTGTPRRLPILFDGEFKGQQRKMLAQVSRNGYFFLLDRVTGKSLVTTKYVPETNWGRGIDERGNVIPDYSKDVGNAQGTLVSPYALGATNSWAPAYDPKTGLIFVNGSRSWNFISRSGRGNVRYPREYVTMAIDYKTGKVVWTHELGNKGTGNLISGLLTTAGGVLFGGDSVGNFLAMDPATGKTLWHVNVDQFVTNAPMTYELDGRQYVLVAANDTFFAFALPNSGQCLCRVLAPLGFCLSGYWFRPCYSRRHRLPSPDRRNQGGGWKSAWAGKKHNLIIADCGAMKSVLGKGSRPYSAKAPAASQHVVTWANLRPNAA